MSRILRPYQADDFDAFYRMDQACYPPGIAYSKRTLRWFLGLPKRSCLVAEEGNEITGFILATREEDYAHIITLDVLPHYRRRGTGSALLAGVEKVFAANGVRQVELETATDNVSAIAFWEKHGYRTVDLLRDYYGVGLDARAMEKDLAPHTDSAGACDE